MAKIEVDETQYLASRDIVGLVADINKDPALRMEFLKMAKTAQPTRVIPEIDAVAPFEAQLSAMRKEQSEFMAALAKRDADAKEAEGLAAFERSWTGQKNALRDQGYLAEGVAAVEEFAKKRGIPDLEAAAALYEKQHPPQQVAAPISGGRAFDFFKPDTTGAKAMDDLMKSRGQSAAAESQLVAEAIAEARSANRRY